jgi:hypothetical protein
MYEFLAKWTSAAGSVYENSKTLMDLYQSEPTDVALNSSGVSNDVTLARVLSHGHMTASSSFPESPNMFPVADTMTSESISLDAACNGEDVDGENVELSLWLQWTLMKFVVNIFSESRPTCGMNFLSRTSAARYELLFCICH